MSAETRAYVRLLGVAFAGLVLLAVYLTVVQLPDIRRYLKMRSM